MSGRQYRKILSKQAKFDLDESLSTSEDELETNNRNFFGHWLEGNNDTQQTLEDESASESDSIASEQNNLVDKPSLEPTSNQHFSSHREDSPRGITSQLSKKTDDKLKTKKNSRSDKNNKDSKDNDSDWKIIDDAIKENQSLQQSQEESEDVGTRVSMKNHSLIFPRKRLNQMAQRGRHQGRKQTWLSEDSDNLPYAKGIKLLSSSTSTGSQTFSLVYDNQYEENKDKGLKQLLSFQELNLNETLVQSNFNTHLLLNYIHLNYTKANRDITGLEWFIRVVVYSLEMGFPLNFSPFIRDAQGLPQINVLPDENKIIYEALFLYMNLRIHQGHTIHPLFICKILLAMDMSNDYTHSLLHLDYLFIRSRKFSELIHFSHNFVMEHIDILMPADYMEHIKSTHIENEDIYTANKNEAPSCNKMLTSQIDRTIGRTDIAIKNLQKFLKPKTHTINNLNGISELDMMFPNFAFSIAMALHLPSTEMDPSQCVKKLKYEHFYNFLLRKESFENSDQLRHLYLMRAFLLFPHFLRYFEAIIGTHSCIEIRGVYDVNKIQGLLPFKDSNLYTHPKFKRTHLLLLRAYLLRNKDIWNSSINIVWLVSIAAKLAEFYEDKSKSEALSQFFASWQNSEFLIDLNKYGDIELSEFGQNPHIPNNIIDQRLIPTSMLPHQPVVERVIQAQTVEHEHINPFSVFVGTLLPLNEESSFRAIRTIQRFQDIIYDLYTQIFETNSVLQTRQEVGKLNKLKTLVINIINQGVNYTKYYFKQFTHMIKNCIGLSLLS